MDERIAQFKRVMQSKGRTRKDLWRRIKPLAQGPTDSLSLTGPSRNGERPAPHLGKQQELFMDEQTLKAPFDKRIDQIGMANELVKLYTEDLKDGVKDSLTKKQADRAEGELFDAILVKSESRSIDADAIIELFVKRKISRQQLCSALKVNVDACEEFLSREVVDGMSTTKATTSLRITRKKGVALVLLDCLRGISAAILPKSKAA